MRNAWHFYHALISVIKVVCGNIVLRCSPLKRALNYKVKIWQNQTSFTEKAKRESIVYSGLTWV
ncbi:hypothetical protein CGK17_23505 [Vibrio parahaemolyticus]|nr:hypothetical protein CGK17_23505 [Vibrio parahaemolyticus]